MTQWWCSLPDTDGIKYEPDEVFFLAAIFDVFRQIKLRYARHLVTFYRVRALWPTHEMGIAWIS